MIGGNPHDFLDRIYSCQDTIYIYDNIKYWFQGYMPNSNSVHMEIIQYQPASEHNVWSYDASSISDCQQAFVHAPLFNGKTFWEAEQDIQWVDD